MFRFSQEDWCFGVEEISNELVRHGGTLNYDNLTSSNSILLNICYWEICCFLQHWNEISALELTIFLFYLEKQHLCRCNLEAQLKKIQVAGAEQCHPGQGDGGAPFLFTVSRCATTCELVWRVCRGIVACMVDDNPPPKKRSYERKLYLSVEQYVRRLTSEDQSAVQYFQIDFLKWFFSAVKHRDSYYPIITWPGSNLT